MKEEKEMDMKKEHNDKNHSERMTWWREARYGMFVHWGLYSLLEGEWKGEESSSTEQIMCRSKMSIKEYEPLAAKFNPVHFNAKEWITLAKEAGMKYFIITAKHHDGFAMYKSFHPYNIVERTPFGRDPLKELEAECNRQGIVFGLYYSLGRDWHHPDVPTGTLGAKDEGWRSNLVDYPDESKKVYERYFREKAYPQVEEMLKMFPSLKVLWFDTPEHTTYDQARELHDLIRRENPSCIINSRIGGNSAGHYRPGDTSYREVCDYIEAEDHQFLTGVSEDWEIPETLNNHWGCSKFDNNWKSAETILESLKKTTSAGGNLLLNVGPDGMGRIPAASCEILRSVGKVLP